MARPDRSRRGQGEMIPVRRKLGSPGSRVKLVRVDGARGEADGRAAEWDQAVPSQAAMPALDDEKLVCPGVERRPGLVTHPDNRHIVSSFRGPLRPCDLSTPQPSGARPR